MGCDINGSGCKICPGMWIAAILFLVMTLQSVFFQSAPTRKTPAKESTTQNQEANFPPETPQ
jgi:hypothetical protein